MLAATILADSDEIQVLRSVHPLASILSLRERWAVMGRFATGAMQPAVRA